MKMPRKSLSRMLLIPLLTLVAFYVSTVGAFCATTTGSWQDITASVTVTKTKPLYDLARNVYTSQVYIKNTPSTVPIAGMLRAVITASSKIPLNPDGTSEDGKPFYFLETNPLATLAVNQSTLPRAISFTASRGVVTYSVRIENWQENQLTADMTIAKTHVGNFSQGQVGAGYSIIVTNNGAGATSGLVTVTDALPAGLTATAMAGSGWNCTVAPLSCTRGDELAAGSSYPPISLSVNVASDAPASVSNSATVAGGGETDTSNNTANDPTTINAVIPQPGIQVSPTPLQFGDVTVNTSASLPLTIANPGTAELLVSSITASGLPFSVFPPTSFSVPAGATRLVNIGFSPTVAGSVAGSVTINSNAAGQNTLNVNLSGTGLASVGLPILNAPTAVDFGAVIEGQSATREVTINNAGTAPLILSGANAPSASFDCSPPLPLTILPGASANITVSFAPGSGSGGTTLGDTLALVSNGGNANVALSGNSVAPVIQPPSQTVLSARVKNGAVYDSITAASCASVGGEVQFGSGSLSSDNFIVTLTDQVGTTVSSAAFSATQGAGTTSFSGIATCGLKDGTIGLTVTVNSLSPATGTPAAKNTSTTFGPITLEPLAPATVFSTIQVCGSAPAGSLVQIAGGSSTASLQMQSVQTTFCLDVSLRKNTENLLIASATDTTTGNPTSGQVATAQPVKVTQVDPSSVLIAQASSRPLTTEEVETLVQNGVINLNDPSNFNVSMFTIVLTIGSFPVTISQPVVVNPIPGTISYGSGGATGGWGGGGGGGGGSASSGSSSQIVVIQTPTGQTIPGVIIIDGRIKTLKEFFQVTIAIQNVTTQFDLSDMNANIALPAGLSPVKAGLGTDVANINSGSAIDTVNLGTIGPGETGTGQFIIRGDSIGTHDVTVNFDGFLSGGGLPSPTPISGSAGTSVQVFGPPTLDVSAIHPSHVTLNQIYTLTINVKNTSQVPALYTSMDLLVGQGAVLVDTDGNPLPPPVTASLGNIQPGQTVSQSFLVKSKLEGDVIACQAVASENITLTVDVGGLSCNISNTIPVNFIPPPAEAPPTLLAINPLNNQPNIPITSSVMAILTPVSNCLTPDTWTNVVTDWIDPADHTKGIKVVSADLLSSGTFYLEELDASKNPVRHIPTDLTVTTGVNNDTTIAVLRLGLAVPLSQYFLKTNTLYRATLVGGSNGVCNATVPATKLASTYQWIFSTEQTCLGISAPTVTLTSPPDGSIDRPLNQTIVLDFSQRMNPGSFSFDAVTPLNSSFVVLSGGSVVGDDVAGGAVVPGSATFSNLFQTFTYTPTGNLPTGQPIYVRLKNSITDTCGQPLQTPPSGIKLLSFTTIPPDTTPPALPIVNPVPALTGQASIQVSGSAEALSTVTVTGGASTVTTTSSAAGLFSVIVPLNLNSATNLQVKAKDASNNESAAVSMDMNGAPLSVVNDSTTPMVAALSIPNGASDIPRNASITVTMSENINPGTINDLNFKLEGSVIPGTFTLINPTTFSFTPTALLDYNKTYTVRMRAGGISDLAGNSLASEYVSTFSTEAFPVPTLTMLDPASGTQGTTFNVTFTGTNLATASAVVSDNPGVSGGIIASSDTSVTANITITALAATGPANLGLTTLGGTASLPFTVTASANAVLIAHWGFNETGGTTAFDSAGSVNGTLVGGATFTTTGGVSGGAIQITDGYITMGNNFASTPAFSVQAWVKIAVGDISALVPVAKHWSGIAQGYLLAINNIGDGYTQANTESFYSANGGYITAVGGPPVNDGLWHQLVGVYNNGVTSIYVDGNLAGSGSAGYSNNSADFMVGGMFNSAGTPVNSFHGLIDEVEVYNSALTGNEVKALYDSYVSGVPTLTQLSPPDGVQGTSFNVIFTGTNLATASAVVSANPGVSGTITSVGDTSVVASITVTPLATTGVTTLGLDTLGGTVSLPFTVNAAGIISLANFEVGKDMQVNTVAIFTPAPAAGTVVTITSSDASKLLLSTNPAAAGSGSLNYTMSGGAAIGDLYAQALAGSGTAGVTISAPGYASVTATATLRPSGFVITTPDFSNVVGDPDTSVTVAARMLNDVLTPVATSQLRGGFTANVPVVSSNPAVGTIITSPVSIMGGSSTSSTTFRPLAGGSTIISLTAPAGFNTPTSGQSITATVVGKVITLNTPTTTLVTRASYNYSVNLAAPAGPGGQVIDLSATGSVITIPATVTVPEGGTSVGFTVETALATGPVILSATAPGFTGDIRNLTVADRSFTLSSPLVGIDRTVTATITLDQPAPSGGATFNLSVANTTIATVTPAILEIPAGSSTGTFQLKGGLIIGFTTVSADGTSNGYVSKTLNITVTDRLLDLPAAADAALGTTLTVPLLIAPDAAPAGGVEITVTSSNPAIVQVLTPTVTVPEGTFQATVQVQAAAGATGSATITASNPGFAPDVMQVTVTSGFNILESFANFDAAETDTLHLQLISGNNPFPAPAGGIQATLASSDTSCVVVTSPATIAEGATFGTATLNYGGTAALPCSATVTATNTLFGTDTVQVTVGLTPDLGAMTISDNFHGDRRIGAGLEAPYRVTLATGNHGGITIQIKSDNPAVAQVATNSTATGTPVVEVTIPNGQSYADFYLQGVSGAAGSAGLSARTARFTKGTVSVAVVPPILHIYNLATSTTSLSADDPFFVRSGYFDSSGTSFQYAPVSGAADLTVTLTSSNPAVGALVTTPLTGGTVTVTIAKGSYDSPSTVAAGGPAFDPLTGGTTVVAATAPGTNNAYSGSTVNVTVSQPGITIIDSWQGDYRIGANLEAQYQVTLGGASHGGVTVRIASSSPAVAKVSLTSTTVGSDFIDVPFADGETVKYFYLQGVSNGAATLTATQALFTEGTVNITVVPPVLNIYGLATSTTSLSADDPFYVRSGYLHTNGTSFLYAPVSGAADLAVTLTSSNPAVGALVTTPLTGGTVTVTISKGSYDTAYSVATGGPAFDPLTGGTTVVAATAPGTNNAYSGSTVNVTVSQPGITIADSWQGDYRIGANLEAQYQVTLGGASHGGVTVRIASSSPAVAKVSLTSTTVGSDFIDVPFADGETVKYFYLQGVSNGVATLTATQALFTEGTVNVTVVPPVLNIYGLATSTTSLSANDPFYVRSGYLHTNGTSFLYAPVSGAADLTVTLTSSNPAVGALITTPLTGGTVTVTIAKGSYDSPSTVAAGGPAFDPLTGGTTVVAATAPGTNNAYSGSTVNVTVSQPGITIADSWQGDYRIGANLEAQYQVTLGGASHGGVTVRIASSSPAVAKVSLTSTTVGSDFIDVPFADGETVKYFYLQGVSNGAATLTATQALFTEGTVNVTVVPPVLNIYGLATSTTSLSADDPFYVRSGYLHTNGTSFLYAPVSGAADLTVTLTSSNPAVGTLVTTPLTGGTVTVTISKGSYDTAYSVATGGPAFDPLTGGVTTVAATAPGTNNAYSGSTVSVTVSQPGITITDSWNGDYRLGGGLEAPYTITLGGSAHGGVTIRVASTDTTRILLAPDGTTAGTSFIDLFIPDGQTTKGFYIQGINGVTGTVALNATNVAFTTGTANVELVQGAIYIYNLGTSLGVAAADDPFIVRTGYIHSNGSTFQYARVSPAGPLHVLLTSSAPAVGQLKTAAATGAQVTVDVAVNAYDSPSTVATGGAAFDPLIAGSTTVSASVNGFNNSYTGAALAVTVTP